MKIIDAFGMKAPAARVSQKEIDAGCRELSVQVDNETAVKNLTRLAAGRRGLAVAVDDRGRLARVAWRPRRRGPGAREAVPAVAGASAAAAGAATPCSWRPRGQATASWLQPREDGAVHASESDDVPASLLFMNAGVKLVAGGEQQVVDSVRALEEKGCEVLVCGTCLDFYGCKDQLAVGEVSNMYDILGRMVEAAKVITL